MTGVSLASLLLLLAGRAYDSASYPNNGRYGYDQFQVHPNAYSRCRSPCSRPSSLPVGPRASAA